MVKLSMTEVYLVENDEEFLTEKGGFLLIIQTDERIYSKNGRERNRERMGSLYLSPHNRTIYAALTGRRSSSVTPPSPESPVTPLVLNCPSNLHRTDGAFITGDNDGYVTIWNAQSKRRVFEGMAINDHDADREASNSTIVERIVEFTHRIMDKRPRKRPRLDWDMPDPVHPPPKIKGCR
ncbi:putative dual-specificity kinase [Helianthus annuus]|uniref:Dual-specificity kinase n=1 Tax=Helianthus annuus TaxID=4232 RepID=A0A251U691_HELAN|nr:putative dual-specificity kinase [Helianthus annuus]KAJ0722439.1 putative dual-specificity kinase [Helianthus annuus]